MGKRLHSFRKLVDSGQNWCRRASLVSGDSTFNKSRLRKGFVGGCGRLGDPRCRRSIGGPRRCWRAQLHIQLRKYSLRVVGDKSGPSEPPENVFFRKGTVKGSPKRKE